MTDPSPITTAGGATQAMPATHPGWRLDRSTLVLVLAAGVASLAVGLRTRWYDYDEITRAHSTWLAAQGLRPYTDFFECHPPYFPLLTPLVRLFPDSTDLLQALRVFGVAGNLLFIGGLAALGASSSGDRRWAWLGLGVVACHPAVLDYLVEFRIDGWGYALATWALVLFRRSPRGPRRNFVLGLLAGLASFLFSPKLALLPPLIILFELVGSWRSPRDVLRAGAAYAAGTGLAGGLVLLWLAWRGIRPNDAYQLLAGYHSIANANSTYHLGLLDSILSHPLLVATTLLGLAAWAAAWRHGLARPDAIDAALLAWLGLQAILVAYPYKQYFAPWFLFASVFLAHLGTAPAGRRERLHATLFVAAGGLAIFASLHQASNWYRIGEARREEDLIRWMDRVAGPDDRVVAAPPHHPIDRHDTFFVWFNTFDPDGFDSEQILRRLPSLQKRVSEATFRDELQAHPPALIAMSGPWISDPYTEGQRAALGEFIARRGYQTVRRGKVEFAIRPDRLDASR